MLSSPNPPPKTSVQLPSQISCTFLLLAARLIQKEISSRSTLSSGHSKSIFINCQEIQAHLGHWSFQSIRKAVLWYQLQYFSKPVFSISTRTVKVTKVRGMTCIVPLFRDNNPLKWQKWQSLITLNYLGLVTFYCYHWNFCSTGF